VVAKQLLVKHGYFRFLRPDRGPSEISKFGGLAADPSQIPRETTVFAILHHHQTPGKIVVHWCRGELIVLYVSMSKLSQTDKN